MEYDRSVIELCRDIEGAGLADACHVQLDGAVILVQHGIAYRVPAARAGSVLRKLLEIYEIEAQRAFWRRHG